MEALAIGSAPPRPGLPAPTRYSHLRRPKTLAVSASAAPRRLLAAVPMDGTAGGRSTAPPQCARAETDSEDAVATSSHAAEAETAGSAGATEQGNGSLVADATTADVEGVDGIRIRRRPVTGPPVHYVGPFQFRLENEGNTPRNILEKIVWSKEAEVSQLKERRPLYMLKGPLENAPPARDFVGALKASYDRTGLPALIAEVKKASPSRGVLRENFDPVQIAQAYEKNGAACLSVLTDEKYFQTKKKTAVFCSRVEAELRAMTAEVTWLKWLLTDFGAPVMGLMTLLSDSTGAISITHDPVKHELTKHISVDTSYMRSQVQEGALCFTVCAPRGNKLQTSSQSKPQIWGSFEYLEAIRNAGVKCPLLCKEFIVDAWQLHYARSKGADAVLLIAAVLPDLDIKYMLKICKILSMAALVEVHDEREMDRVLGIDGIQLIGINNRNLETFEVDISNTRRLLEGERGQIIAQKDIMVVGESGLFSPEHISFVQNAGVKAVLVGESLIKQEDPGKAIAGLLGKDISHAGAA